MNRASIIAAAAFAVASAAAAQKLDPAVEAAVRQSIPVCGDVTFTTAELPMKLPTGFTGTVVRTAGSRPTCEGQFASVLSPTGGFFLGMPWYIASEEGATPEARLKSFAWRNLQENVTPVVEKTRTADGLYRVTLNQTVEGGKIPITGEMDAEGKVFFFGHFRRLKGDVRAERAKAFEKLAASAPTRGAAKPAVTILEFSDFECPSCKRSADYTDPILAAHGEKVRHVRFDLPLSGHPWSLPASMAGRAIAAQKPELFWKYKKEVYDNQERLNPFSFDDFARGFAETHQLDMKRYDADVTSSELRQLLLDGAGAAYSNDIRATPTFLVNGALVDAGENGKALVEYVNKLVAQ